MIAAATNIVRGEISIERRGAVATVAATPFGEVLGEADMLRISLSERRARTKRGRATGFTRHEGARVTEG